MGRGDLLGRDTPHLLVDDVGEFVLGTRESGHGHVCAGDTSVDHFRRLHQLTRHDAVGGI